MILINKILNSYNKHRGITIDIWLNGSGGVKSAPKIKKKTMTYLLELLKVSRENKPNFTISVKIKGNWNINEETIKIHEIYER